MSKPREPVLPLLLMQHSISLGPGQRPLLKVPPEQDTDVAWHVPCPLEHVATQH